MTEGVPPPTPYQESRRPDRVGGFHISVISKKMEISISRKGGQEVQTFCRPQVFYFYILPIVRQLGWSIRVKRVQLFKNS